MRSKDKQRDRCQDNTGTAVQIYLKIFDNILMNDNVHSIPLSLSLNQPLIRSTTNERIKN